MQKYSAKILNTIEKPGVWNRLRIGIFQISGGGEEQIGEYVRNHWALYDTFLPFESKGKELALYSADYTSTRIMELPSCRDIGGEDRNSGGFCPVEFFVPTFIDQEISNDLKVLYGENRIKRVNNPDPKDLVERTETNRWTNQITNQEMESHFTYKPLTDLKYYEFGFVAGCYWGDDSSWKVQYLDLSEASEGIVKRDERFGYVALPKGMKLREAIKMSIYSGGPEDHNNYIEIDNVPTFDLRSGKIIHPFD